VQELCDPLRTDRFHEAPLFWRQSGDLRGVLLRTSRRASSPSLRSAAIACGSPRESPRLPLRRLVSNDRFRTTEVGPALRLTESHDAPEIVEVEDA